MCYKQMRKQLRRLCPVQYTCWGQHRPGLLEETPPQGIRNFRLESFEQRLHRRYNFINGARARVAQRFRVSLPAALRRWAKMSTVERAFTAMAIVLSVLLFALTVALRLSASNAVPLNLPSREFLCLLLGSL